MANKHVKIENVDIGADSHSGLAFSCKIEDKHYWVPYSVCRARHINKQVHNMDAIEVEAWWAEKNEIEGEEC